MMLDEPMSEFDDVLMGENYWRSILVLLLRKELA